MDKITKLYIVKMDWVNRFDVVRSDYVHVTIVNEGDRLECHIGLFRNYFGNIMKPYILTLAILAGQFTNQIYREMSGYPVLYVHWHRRLCHAPILGSGAAKILPVSEYRHGLEFNLEIKFKV